MNPGPSPWAIGLAGALSLAAAIGIGRFAFTPMLPLMAQDGLIDVAGGGWVAAANYAGYLAGALTASRLGLPAPRLALLALALNALLAAAMAWSSVLWLWALLRLLAGMASAWVFVATSVWCLGALARHPQTAWSSLLYAGVGGGIALTGALCLVAAVAGASASALWLQLGLLAALLALPVAVLLRRQQGQGAVAGPAAHGQHGGGAGRVAGLVFSYGLFGFGYILPATFLPAMARELVPEPRLFGLAWPVFGLTALLSTWLAGLWLRRVSRLRVWATSHLLMGLGVLLPSVWLSGWTIGLSALLVGGTFMVATLAGLQEARSRAAGDPTALLARMTTAFAIGQIAGPIASTLLLWIPALQPRGLQMALQLGAAGLLASAAWLEREGRRR